MVSEVRKRLTTTAPLEATRLFSWSSVPLLVYTQDLIIAPMFDLGLPGLHLNKGHKLGKFRLASCSYIVEKLNPTNYFNPCSENLFLCPTLVKNPSPVSCYGQKSFSCFLPWPKILFPVSQPGPKYFFLFSILAQKFFSRFPTVSKNLCPIPWPKNLLVFPSLSKKPSPVSYPRQKILLFTILTKIPCSSSYPFLFSLYLKGLPSPLQGYWAELAGMGFLLAAQSRQAARGAPSHAAAWPQLNAQSSHSYLQPCNRCQNPDGWRGEADKKDETAI